MPMQGFFGAFNRGFNRHDGLLRSGVQGLVRAWSGWVMAVFRR